MKRKISLFLSIVIAGLLVMPIQNVFAQVFSDVALDHENATAIEFLKENGYVDGHSDNTFKPDDDIARAEAVKILVSGVNLDLTTDNTVLFVDVVGEDWYFPFVMTAYEQGIISTSEESKFYPNETITLAESLKIMAEALRVNLPSFDDDYGNIYSDVHSSDWYSRYAAYAKEMNIVLMDEYGNIYPDEPMTRADFAEIMYRFIYVTNNGIKFPMDLGWVEHSSDFLPFSVKYPADFEVLKYQNINLNQVVIWKSDSRFFQHSPERLYPNTAKFVVSLDVNEAGLGQSEYFSNLKQVFGGYDNTEFTFDGFPALKVRRTDLYFEDWYVYLNGGKVLVVNTSAGSGIVASQQRKLLDAMLSSMKYQDVGLDDGPDYTDIKGQIFENVLVEGKGMDMLGLIPDEVVIETDAIGVGTGAIDYYYSSEFDLTLKYERAGDVILDTREGSTTAF